MIERNVYCLWLLRRVNYNIPGIQSLSRSYFTKIIPSEKSGEYFGLMDVCGKGASFLGTTMISVLSQWTGQVNLSLGALSIFFILGILFFKMSEKSI